MSEPVPLQALLVAARLKSDGRADVPPFTVYGVEAMLGFGPKDWIVAGLFGPGDRVLIYGPPGGGKTFAVLDTMVRGAAGLPIFDRMPCLRPFSSLYASEEALAGLPARLEECLQHLGISPGSDAANRLGFMRTVPKLFANPDEEDGIRGFIAEVNARQKTVGKVDTLIIDHLSDAAVGSDENSNSDAATVNARGNEIERETGCSLWLLHHPRKAGDTYRGASAYLGKMDAVIEITGTEGARGVVCKKLKDGELFKPFSFHVERGLVSAHVSWQDGAVARPDDKESRAKAETREMIAVLSGRASSRDTAMTVAQILAAMSYAPSPNTLKARLAAAADDGQSGIEKVHKPTVGEDGKKNRAGWHYYIDNTGGW